MRLNINNSVTRHALKILSLILVICLMVSSSSVAAYLDCKYEIGGLSNQTIVLTPEQGVEIILSGMMPIGGNAEAVKADIENDDNVLHAYDITIFYADGKEFEPENDYPINVVFKSDLIADAVADENTSLEVEHLADNGKKESIDIFSTEDDEACFEAESFSVYIIRTHTANTENLKPRKTFHFLSPIYTEVEEDGSTYYQSEAYEFLNKVNDKVTTQTVTDGECLQEIIIPDNNDTGLFYGWYVVNLKSESDGVYTYYWGSEEPQRIEFNEEITVDEEDDTDVYLAPLFGHYRFLTFHQDVEDGENANTIITRKLIVLSEDKTCKLKISDVRAPSSNPNRIVFWGWTYTHRDTDSYVDESGSKVETLQTVSEDDSEIETYITIEDTNVISSRQPTEEELQSMIFDIWPVFKEARWVYFESGGNGADYVSPQFIMIDEPPTGFSNVPEREGYTFRGWWYYKTESDGTVTETQVTDGDANVLSVSVNLDTGVSIDDGKFTLTTDAEELTLYAKWLAADTAVFHVIVWKQKITDSKNLEDSEKTYDFYGYYELTGSTDENAVETSAFTDGGYTTLHTTDTDNFLGFEYNAAQTSVTDNGYGDVGDKVNPNGSTVVNVYYDRVLMTITYHYTSSQVSGTTSSGGYAYLATTSNTGEQYGYVDGEYVSLTVVSSDDATYMFPYKYTQSDEEEDTMYGVIDSEYVLLTKEGVGTVYSYNLTSGYMYKEYSGSSAGGHSSGGGGTKYYGIYEGDFVRVYSKNSQWYRTKNSNSSYSDEYTGTVYSRSNSSYSSSYTGARYAIDDNDTLSETDAETGNLYGLYNGYYVPLEVTESVEYYIYTYEDAQYTGTRYLRSNDSTVYDGTVYEKTDTGFSEADDDSTTIYGYRNSAYEIINKSTDTTYTWYTSDGSEYTGTRYIRFTESSDSDYPYEDVWTGLFGQSFSRYGYSWPTSYKWNEDSNGGGTTQTLLSSFSQITDSSVNTDYHLYCQGSANTGLLYHLRQKLDGTYTIDDENYYDIAHVSTGSVTFTFSNKFDGFDVCAYSTTFSETASGASAVSDGDKKSLNPSNYTYYVYHERKSDLVLEYNDNYNGNVYEMSGLKYQQPLNSYEDAYTPAEREHYTFTGWYEDSSCTKLFDFNSVMPDANKMIYAGWKAVRYRITVDPDGGEFPLGGNFSTYFKINYGELVSEYSSTKRNYVEDDDGDYLYVCITYDRVKDMVLPDGNTVDLDACFRKAFYIKKTGIETAYNSYFSVGDTTRSYSETDDEGNNTVMTLEQFKSCIDMNTTYSPVEDGTVEYRLVSWHKVKSDGSLEQTPFNFSMQVGEDTNIRAKWVRLGKYSLTYNPTMTSTGITGEMSQYNDPLSDDLKYSDQSTVIVLQKPTDIVMGDGSSADEYVFRGWRIVDGSTAEPLEDDVFYDPGDTMTLNAKYADSSGVIHMEAYYEKAESTVRRVDVTSLYLNANSDTAQVNSQGLANDKYEYADTSEKQVVKARQNNNFDIDLSEYIKNFTNTDGSFLLGWNTTSEADDYIPDYYADAVLGVNKNDMPNNLYALWEPMVYITLKNTTSFDILFNISFSDYDGTVYAGHTNEMTGVYERQAFSDDENVTEYSSGNFDVTLVSGDSVQLVLPEGEGETYTITGSYAGTDNKTLIVYNSGADSSLKMSYQNRNWYLNDNTNISMPYEYTTSGTLVNGSTGRLVMFTEENPETELDLITRYYDIESGSWVNGTLTTGAKADAHFVLPDGYSESTSSDGYTTTVSLINNTSTTTFGLKVNSYDSENYKFIGWYTDAEAAPNQYTVDGISSGFGDQVISDLTVPVETTTYYALFVPYVSGSLTVNHSEKADTAGHCADDDGLSLTVAYDNVSVTKYGDTDVSATYTIPETYIYEKNTTGSVSITVGATPHDGSVYKSTYIGSTVLTPTEVDEYLVANYTKTVPELLSDSDTVKGLKVINDLDFYSVFSQGYTVTYIYTARDGSEKEYVLSGSADTFEDFETFVIENTPYIRTLTGDTVWDTENIELVEDEYGMTATLEEKSNIRDKCTVTLVLSGGYTPSERVAYGETFSETQAEKYISVLDEYEAENEGYYFDYWDIKNTDTGEHIAKCYSKKFTFIIWNNYTLTPHYYTKDPEEKSEEGTFITVDYIDTSRNQWGSVEKSDDSLVEGSGFSDKVVADMDITFIDGSNQILADPDNYQLGVIFEICGSTSDGTFDTDECSKTESCDNTQKRVDDIINKTKDNGTGTDYYDSESSKTGYYYSKISIDENTVSTFNRSEFARSFSADSVKNRVFRVYAYMKTPDGTIVLSDPKYITLYDYASVDLAVDG